MKLINYLCVFAALATFIACGSIKGVNGEGPIIKDERMLTAVNEIVLSSSVRAEVISGESQKIVVHAQANIQPVLKTTIKGETLTIDIEGNVSMTEDTYVLITIPQLKSATTNSSGSISGSGFSGDNLKLSVSSSGDISLTGLNYEDYEAKVSSSGDILLEGRGKKLDAETNGSGDINASGLVVDKAKATTKSSGNIMVAVGGELKAKITGSGNISYDGSPKVDLEDDGSGELKGNN